MPKLEIPSKRRFVIAAIYAAVSAVCFLSGCAGNHYSFPLSLVWAVMAAVWAVTGIHQRQLEEQRSQPAAPAENAPIQAFPGPLAQGERSAAQLHRLRQTIQNPTVHTQTEHLETTARKVLAQIALRPEKQTPARQFLDYYLPTSVKVLDAYCRMDASSGPEIQTLRGRIEAILEDLCAAFDKQLDALLRDEAMDISTDITVMEQMLQQEGFGGMTMGGA